MKSNKIEFISKFKWIMLAPIVLLLMSIILGAIFGPNLDYDFRTVSTFNVKFNTTISTDEYKVFEKELKSIVNDSEIDSFRIDRIGEFAQNGLFVQIVNEDGEYNTQIDTLKVNIEENLLKGIDDKIESPVVITTSETIENLPRSAGNLILWSSITMALILLFAFFYYLIRYNFISGVSLVLTILSEIAMLTTVMIVARIPFNYYFVVSYFVMALTTIILTTVINNSLRDGLRDEKFNKYSNADRVYNSIANVFVNSSIFMGILALAVLAVMFFGSVSLVYTSLSIIVGLIISYLASFVLFTSIWSFWYKKDKDIILKKRIEAEKNKQENKTDDKIVV